MPKCTPFYYLSKAKFWEVMCLKSTFNGLLALFIFGSRQKHLDIYIAIFLTKNVNKGLEVIFLNTEEAKKEKSLVK